MPGKKKIEPEELIKTQWRASGHDPALLSVRKSKLDFMKKYLFIFLFIACQAAAAQQISFSPLVERTVAGWQYGSSLLYENSSKWGFGAFYQSIVRRGPEGITMKNPFAGILINTPVSKSEKLNLYVHTRIGLTNNRYVVLVPGLETELKLVKHLSISGVMSFRMGYPSAMGKVNIKF